MNCELISVGTEILLGDILNTNAQFLSTQMASLGFNVLFQCTVGDNRNRLLGVLKKATERSDFLILTGGLGPTPDDMTKEVCAEFFEKELILHEPSLRQIEDFYKLKNLPMPECNIKQALIPEGATVLTNDNGTAPGLAIEDVPEGAKITFHTEAGDGSMENIKVENMKGTFQREHVGLSYYDGGRANSRSRAHEGGVTFDLLDRDLKQ